jgi:hypothetical protein
MVVVREVRDRSLLQVPPHHRGGRGARARLAWSCSRTNGPVESVQLNLAFFG